MGLIRFILACGVVICHTSLIFGYKPLSGDLAVQCFYIISGFYMSLILNEKYVGKNATYLFYTNRALKIFPVYWVNLLLLISWSVFVYFKGKFPGTVTLYNQNYISPLVVIYFILSNIFLIGLDWFFLFGLNKNGSLFFTKNFNSTNPKVYNFAFNSIAWTVGTELIFYLFAPFIVTKKIWIIVTLLILSLGLRMGLAYHGLNFAPWNYMFFPTQIMFFMAGVLSYHLHNRIKYMNFRKYGLLILYFVFLFIICFYYKILQDSIYKEVFLFISTTLLIPFIFILTKNSKIDGFFGDLSYPIYISQAFVITLSNVKAFPKPFGQGVSVLICVILFSLLLKPLDKYRQKRMLFCQEITNSK